MKQPLTLDQQRAEYAWQAAQRAAQEGLIDKYTNLAKSVASLIMNSGLMQTLAFLQSKKDEQHDILLHDLCQWLGRTLGDAGLANGSRFPTAQQASFDKVMNALYQAPSDLYMRANSETMALLRWLRQLADARKSQAASEGDKA